MTDSEITQLVNDFADTTRGPLMLDEVNDAAHKIAKFISINTELEPADKRAIRRAVLVMCLEIESDIEFDAAAEEFVAGYSGMTAPERAAIKLRWNGCEALSPAAVHHLLEGEDFDEDEDEDEDSLSKSPHSQKLDEKTVHEILTLEKSGLTQKAIAENIGVSSSTIGNILNGRTWSSVSGRGKHVA